MDTPGEALRAAVQEGVYLVKPNLRELSDLVDHDLREEAQQEAAVMDLVRQGNCQVVVLSLGAAGVLLGSAAGCERFRAPTVPIASKVGAGDSTLAGLVLSLARDLSLREAVRFGIAAGTAAVMTPGTELCRREDTERLYTRLINAQTIER
nr:PfkB family carbohydrate kinase [Candidatus Entotheonella palauensis]